jgi:hypothetical protein
MKESPFGRVTRSQFESGKSQRLYAEELQEHSWYLARATNKIAREMGAFAVESAVKLKALKPIDDNFEVQVTLLDSDGWELGTGETIMYPSGIMRAPDEPGEEAYFLSYPGYLTGPVGIEVEEPILASG